MASLGDMPNMAMELIIALYNVLFSVSVCLTVKLVIHLAKNQTRSKARRQATISEKQIEDQATKNCGCAEGAEPRTQRCYWTHSIRDFMVDLEPNIQFTDTQVVVSEHTIYLRLDWNSGWRNIEYHDISGGGCSVVSDYWERFSKEANFVNVACHDMKYLEAYQQSISFKFGNVRSSCKVFSNLAKMFGKRSLSDMPSLVLKKIAEKCDFTSIMSLRKVSRDLRDFIIDLKPDIQLTIVVILLDDYGIQFQLYSNDDMQLFNYHDVSGGGCEVTARRHATKHLKDSYYVRVACEDLKLLMAHQKSTLDTLKFSTLKYGDLDNSGLLNEFVNIFSELHTSEDSLIPVTEFIVNSTRSVNIQPLLSILKPGILQRIEVSTLASKTFGSQDVLWSVLELGEVLESEVWKKAKALYIWGFRIETTIRNFLHFDDCVVSIVTMSLEDALALRAMTLQSETFKTSDVYLDSFPEKHQFLDTLPLAADRHPDDNIFFQDRRDEPYYNKVEIFDDGRCFRYKRCH